MRERETDNSQLVIASPVFALSGRYHTLFFFDVFPLCPLPKLSLWIYQSSISFPQANPSLKLLGTLSSSQKLHFLFSAVSESDSFPAFILFVGSIFLFWLYTTLSCFGFLIWLIKIKALVAVLLQLARFSDVFSWLVFQVVYFG